MRLDPTIEMQCDLLASQILRLDDINIHSKKQNRQHILENRKGRLLDTLRIAIDKFRFFRSKYIQMERENKKLKKELEELRRDIDLSLDQGILKENEKLKAELEDIRLILSNEDANQNADEQRLSA